MPKQFKKLNDLYKAIEKKIQESMDDVGEYVEKEVKDQIDREVYSHSQLEYERTYELRESVVTDNPEIKKDGVYTKVHHDTTLINPSLPNKHQSVIDGEPSNEAIPEIVHEGRSGKIFGPGFWTERRPYMEKAHEKLKEDRSHIKVLKKSLNEKGIKTK